MPTSITASSTPSSSAPASALIARDRLVDTLLLARRKHPGGPNRLDDLCARYGIDNSRRTKHGALLDAELLAEVYLELIGARQAQLGLVDTDERRAACDARDRHSAAYRRAAAAPHRGRARGASAFVATLGEGAIWRDYRPAAQSGRSSAHSGA